MSTMTEERKNEIFFKYIMKKFSEGVIVFEPKKIKDSVHNMAQELEFSACEIAECYKIMYETLHKQILEELKKITNEGLIIQ
ncbi:MAG: hypothetical protein AAB913_03435 [Patescibacteria group bacterium]